MFFLVEILEVLEFFLGLCWSVLKASRSFSASDKNLFDLGGCQSLLNYPGNWVLKC